MRYIIGIDLGTTNSCLSYVDTLGTGQVQMLRIPQLNRRGEMEALPTLPSFCFLDEKVAVGAYAEYAGARLPTKLVGSAKSWLCHSAAPRKDPILPLEGSLKISPVEATANYLRHLRQAWNSQMAKGDLDAEFDQQQIILTVPASFDEIARTLTVEAAKLAGYSHLTLLEEPQAAFYSWIAAHEAQWNAQLSSSDTILVCDVGGGTTDFSLIEVNEKGFRRMAVGDHLLLGGDNMDAAIANLMESRLQLQEELDSTQLLQLKCEARKAKEALLGGKEEFYSFVIQKGGSKVIGQTLSGTLKKNEVERLLLDGFFGIYAWDEARKLPPSRGLRSMGLPYEDEPSITKHLAAFLHKHKAQPTKVLFNGGALKPAGFREAIVASLRKWFPEKNIDVLASISLDLAVSRGAAYYGKAQRGLGMKIASGSARTYYLEIGVEGEGPRVLTLLTRGTEEGVTVKSDKTFLLSPNQPVAFHLWSSHVRLSDTPGTILSINPEEMQRLPPIHTQMRFGKTQNKIEVTLDISLTALGTLDLGLQTLTGSHRFKLEFKIRGADGQENALDALASTRVDETFDESYLQEAKKFISSIFDGSSSMRPSTLMEELEKMIGKPRLKWSPAILRGLWEAVRMHAPKCFVSSELECRFWNMVGFCLRPGFGYPMDDFRMNEMWKIMLARPISDKNSDLLIQRLICYRRMAGGFSKGQQMQIANTLAPPLLNSKQSGVDIKQKKGDQYLKSERVRTLGSLELIDVALKRKIGELLLDKICKGQAGTAEFWALGRIGARHLAYGSVISMIPKDICSMWVDQLLLLPQGAEDELLATFGLIARKSDVREFQLPQSQIDAILYRFKDHPQRDRLQEILCENVVLTSGEKDAIFGDHLPPGLTFVGAKWI